MQQLLSTLEDERQRQFRRFVGFSAVAHALLALLFWIGPIRTSHEALPVVERVELVEAMPSARIAKPKPVAPVAKPKPPPPPPPPPPEDVKVLPKEPAPLPKPVVKPKPVEKPPEPKAETKPEPEKDYEDVLADLRKEAGETEPPPAPEPPKAVPSGPAGGPGQLVDPETARWIREVKIHVTRAWILAAGFKTESLVTVVEVDISATGDVLGTRTTKSSGNPWYDESVVRAIEKATPLPAPPEAGEWAFTFDSREAL